MVAGGVKNKIPNKWRHATLLLIWFDSIFFPICAWMQHERWYFRAQPGAAGATRWLIKRVETDKCDNRPFFRAALCLPINLSSALFGFGRAVQKLCSLLENIKVSVLFFLFFLPVPGKTNMNIEFLQLHVWWSVLSSAFFWFTAAAAVSHTGDSYKRFKNRNKSMAFIYSFFSLSASVFQGLVSLSGSPLINQ